MSYLDSQFFLFIRTGVYVCTFTVVCNVFGHAAAAADPTRLTAPTKS